MHIIRHISRLYTALLLILLSGSLTAQTNISSPYSRYGLGQVHKLSSVKSMAMGGVSLAHRSNDFINLANPATYSGFDSTSFVFEGGINGVLSNLRNSNLSILTGNISLAYLLFGFPVSKRVSFSFGLLPYSNMGYNMADSNSIDGIGDVNYNYNGEGGFNKFYGGMSVDILKNLSLGANMSYMFGALNKSRTVTFPQSVNVFGVREQNDTRLSDFIFDYGLYYEKKLKNSNTLSLGIITGFSTSMNAEEAILSESFTGETYGSVYIKDTIENSSRDGQIVIPPYYGGGLMFQKGSKWLIGADYKFQQWSKFSAFGISDSLKNSMEAAIGFSILPSDNVNKNFWSKSTFRFGIRASQTYLQLKNTQLNEYGISFGLAFPTQRSKSTVNLSFEIGQRGTVQNNLIKETFGMISCSLSIYERWFIRRKFD